MEFRIFKRLLHSPLSPFAKRLSTHHSPSRLGGEGRGEGEEKNIYLHLPRTVFLLILLSTTSPAFAWHDKTHLSVAKTAGYQHWYNAAGPDLTKLRAGETESFNHYFNNIRAAEVTPQMVLNQVNRFCKADSLFDREGHLYGAIIAAVRDFKKSTASGKYSEYHLAFAAHYCTDLSNPFHNTDYDDFNKQHHIVNDATVEASVFNEQDRIQKKMYSITLRNDTFEQDLAKEIARIANLTRNLGERLRKENRDMTKDEAYTQLGHSASLFRAILVHLKKK